MYSISNLKQSIDLSDIQIYGKNTVFKGDNKELCVLVKQQGYNMGDLLNMPYLSGQWPQTPHGLYNYLERMYIVSNSFDNSIVNLYCKHRPDNELVPCIPRLISSVNEYIEQHAELYKDIFSLVKQPDCLCVHIRLGDAFVSEAYVNVIEKLSSQFTTVILLAGIHLDEMFSKHDDKVTSYLTNITNILNKNTNIYVYFNDPDVHVSIMALASNLLLHRGGFTAIGSIVSTGKLFVTNECYHVFHSNWIKDVNKPYTLL